MDTNVVLRFIVQDDPVQSKEATRIFEQVLTEASPGFVTLVALAETAWVIDRFYRFSNERVAEAIERLLLTDHLFVQNEQQVWQALYVIRSGKGSFNDALIVALSRLAGCSATLTFDRKAKRIEGFEILRSN